MRRKITHALMRPGPFLPIMAAVVESACAITWNPSMTDPLPNTNRNVSTVSRNLALEPRFNGTGIVSVTGAGPGSGCLISDQWVLTARHVVAGATNGTFFLEGTNRPIVEVHTRPDSDVALVKLAAPLTNYPATPIYQGSSEVGREVWVVGYGRHGQFTGDPAQLGGPFQRHAAMNRVALVTNVGGTAGICLQFIYDTGVDALPLEGATAPGDSGGPMFMEENGRLWVVGEIFGVLFYAPGFYMGRVSSYKEWIRTTTGINFNEALWDADPVTPGIQNGAGSWGGVNSNWYFGRTNFPWAGGYDVVFGAGTNPVGTINLSADTFVGDITFLANNVSQTLAGTETLTLKNSTVVSNATSVTISAPLAGGALTKTGAGTLTLSAVNTYTGGTTIQGGTLAVASDSFLGNGGGVGLAGGTWQIGGGSAFSSARAVAVTASSTLETTNPAGATLTVLFSTTSSTNMLTVAQAGALTLNPGSGQTNELGSLRITGSNTVTLAGGTTRLTSGAGGDTTAGLQLHNGSLILDGGNLVTTNNAFAQFGSNVLTIKADSTYTAGGNFLMAYGGTSTLNLSGGTMAVAGEVRVVQSGSGVMNLDAGLLRLGKFFDAGTGSATVNFNGATVQANANTTVFADTANTTYRVQSGGAVFDTDGRNITFGRALLADAGSPGGGLTKIGAGTLTLSEANTYSSSTTINDGTLRISPTGSLLFVIKGSGVGNGLVGAGNVVIDGQFVFNLAGASTDTNATWTIVDPSLNAIYGTNFMVTGFNSSGGTWTLATNGVTYRFQQSTGVLSVQSSGGGGYGLWVSYWQGVDPGFTNTAPGADPDGDTFSNGLEFAFDGNPTMWTPDLLRLTPAGTNAVASWVERNTGVSYSVQTTTNLVIGPWTNAAVTVTNAADQSGISLTNDYTRKSLTVPLAGRRFFRVQATLAD